MDESEPAIIADQADSEQHQDIPHPWPDLREMFEVVGSKNEFLANVFLANVLSSVLICTLQ
jgi:hypothetical protein